MLVHDQIGMGPVQSVVLCLNSGMYHGAVGDRGGEEKEEEAVEKEEERRCLRVENKSGHLGGDG